MNTIERSPVFADLQREMHDALRAQHPEWIQPDGESPICDSYESRFAEILHLPKKPRNTNRPGIMNSIIPALDSSIPDPSLKVLSQIETIRAKIRAEFFTGFEAYSDLFERAINEAEELAWQTDFPHLFFPELAVEHVRRVITRLLHQRPLAEVHSAFLESSGDASDPLVAFPRVASAA